MLFFALSIKGENIVDPRRENVARQPYTCYYFPET